MKKGETLALVGESGSGKSVTALSVMKLLPYPAASHPTGRIFFKGKQYLASYHGVGIAGLPGATASGQRDQLTVFSLS